MRNVIGQSLLNILPPCIIAQECDTWLHARGEKVHEVSINVSEIELSDTV